MGKTYLIYNEGVSMKGPHALNTKTIAEINEIDDTALGVYLLTMTGDKGGIIVVYVGRGNLKNRLTKHANAKDGKNFYFKVLNVSEDELFKEECCLFRKYGKTDHLDNKNIPALPAGSKLEPCT